jgi:poly(3-hydroxybutyrate) depolymerase
MKADSRFNPVVVMTLLALSDCGPEWASPEVATKSSGLTQETGWGSNPGSLSLCTYVPANLPAHPALVVAMHGCTQSAAAYAAAGCDVRPRRTPS